MLYKYLEYFVFEWRKFKVRVATERLRLYAMLEICRLIYIFVTISRTLVVLKAQLGQPSAIEGVRDNFDTC